MAIIRKKHKENPFVMIDKTFFEDETLSWKAKGLMGYLLSRPENWSIRKADLVNRSQDSETVVETTLNELMIKGYIFYYPERNDDGTIKEWVYLCFETPEDNPFLKESIQKGKEKELRRKQRNKKKNSKTKVVPFTQPELDNPVVVIPEWDNPEVDYPEVDNPPHNNIDSNQNDFNNIEKEEEEEESKISKLADLFGNLIFPANEQVTKEIKKWVKLLPYVIIEKEIENCSLLGARTWNYIAKALQEDKNLNINTIEQLENKIKSHKDMNNKGKKQYSKKPVRVEQSPDELFAAYSAKTAEQQSDVDLEEKKRQIEDKLKQFRAN